MQIFHLDFNFVQRSNDVVKQLIQDAASLGCDTILWEMEDLVRWETCPECVQADSWSKEEFREVLAYAKSLGLESIPLLQTIGHGEYVMKNEKYHSFREDPTHSDCYCVSNPEVRAFLKRWIHEFLELFGELKYFHLGGDEAWWFGSCPKCSQRQRGELYAEHIFDLAEEILQRGIRPGIWADMVLHEKMMGVIPKEFVLWNWNYSVKEAGPFTEAETLLDAGYEVIVCSSVKSVMDNAFTPNVFFHFPNVFGLSTLCGKKGVLGHCITSWSCRQNLIRLSYPMLEIPRLLRELPRVTLDDAKKILGKKYFGFEDAIEAIGKISDTDMCLKYYTGIQWNGLKDSVIPPKDLLKGLIAKWDKDGAEIRTKLTEIIARQDANLQEGLAMLEPYLEEYPLAREWQKTALLQQKWYKLLEEAALRPAPEFIPRFNDIKEEIKEYLAQEETPASAEKNAELLVKPLRDYCLIH